MFNSRDGRLLASSRRRFLGTSVAVVGRIATTAVASIALLGFNSKNAEADGGGDGEKRGHCFLKGTCILTPQGEMPTENLRIGDLVQSLNGPMPIKWIGRQTFRKSTPAWHESIVPIRVARGALDGRSPTRDLYL